MTDKERKDFIKTLKKYKIKFKNSKIASRKFLVELGVYTEKGNLRNNYKNLCISRKNNN